MTGRIFNIQKFSIHDGPGIRTTVFFKGCNLRCRWCHNPESHASQKEILFYKNKCTACGRCKDLTVDDDFICLNGAKEICGRDYTVQEVFREIEKDRAFYEASGGATFSGGECMLQIDFLTELLKICKENGIHTAVDTAGHVPWERFERVRPYSDMFLYDIKTMNPETHKEETGVDNALILQNLGKLLKTGNRIWVRIPVIGGVNDNPEEMQKIHAFFCANGFPEKVELLPYHSMGEHKYAALEKTATEFFVPEQEKLEALKKIIDL